MCPGDLSVEDLEDVRHIQGLTSTAETVWSQTLLQVVQPCLMGQKQNNIWRGQMWAQPCIPFLEIEYNMLL